LIEAEAKQAMTMVFSAKFHKGLDLVAKTCPLTDRRIASNGRHNVVVRSDGAIRAFESHPNRYMIAEHTNN
jgi:hypothetical protein